MAGAGRLRKHGGRLGDAAAGRLLCAGHPPRLVRMALRALKARRRRRASERRARNGVTVHFETRDVLWSRDAMHAGRDDRGWRVEDLVRRDAGSGRVLATRSARSANGEDVLRLLRLTMEPLGGQPVAVASDNGRPFVCALVKHWLTEQGILIMCNPPRTPQHDMWAECAAKGIRRVSGLEQATCLTVDTAACHPAEARTWLRPTYDRPSRDGITYSPMTRAERHGTV